ncbi:MAG: LEA type 2 family protein [Haloarculaceae archaeon]
MLPGRTARLLGAAVAVVVVLAATAVGALAATGSLSAPTVENTSYGWGTVTNDTTAIQTRVVVDNPNPLPIPPVVHVGYTATLNDVTLAHGSRGGIGFAPGRSELSLTAEMPNDRIAQWWVHHVNDGERSTLRVNATVSAPGFSRQLPAKETTIETDVLGGFTREETETVRVRGEPFVRVRDQRASWGTATSETMPLSIGATLTNAHDYPITLDGLAYEVRMGGVTLGAGNVSRSLDLAPGDSGRLNVTAALDTPKMADWWAHHVRNGERSNVSVAMYGLVDDHGERVRVPVPIFEKRERLTTDVLGDGSTSVEALPGGGRRQFQWPTVENTTRSWGRVTDSTTQIRTTGTVDAPDGRVADLLSLLVSQRTTVNGVAVADGRTRVADLHPGENDLAITTAMDNGKVPEWWAKHLNQGERSTVVTRPSVRADVGFTTFDVRSNATRQTVTTDLLAGMNGPRDETVRAGGRDAMTIHRVSSSWGHATPQVAPLDASARATNELPAPVTIDSIHYTVRLNDVTLADRSARVGKTIAPGETATVPVHMVLDDSKMSKWWVSHVRNGERSQLHVQAVATVTAAGQTDQVQLDSLGQDRTIATDLLADG